MRFAGVDSSGLRTAFAQTTRLLGDSFTYIYGLSIMWLLILIRQPCTSYQSATQGLQDRVPAVGMGTWVFCAYGKLLDIRCFVLGLPDLLREFAVILVVRRAKPPFKPNPVTRAEILGVLRAANPPVVGCNHVEIGSVMLSPEATKAIDHLDWDYAFRPTPQVRSFGQILGHIANANFLSCSSANGMSSPSTTNLETLTGKAAIVKAVFESPAYCDTVYETTTDSNFNQPVTIAGLGNRPTQTIR